MAVTDIKVHTAKPVAKPMKSFGEGGLHLRIDPKGSRLGSLAHRFDGNGPTFSFDPYPVPKK